MSLMLLHSQLESAETYMYLVKSLPPSPPPPKKKIAVVLSKALNSNCAYFVTSEERVFRRHCVHVQRKKTVDIGLSFHLDQFHCLQLTDLVRKVQPTVEFVEGRSRFRDGSCISILRLSVGVSL